jgi:hypothetical protein
MVAGAQPAAAQFRPPADPAVGEDYHIEGAVVWWNPQPSLLVTSTSLDIAGTEVDLVNDLGIQQKRLREFRLVLRPGTKHKFRLHYIPIQYSAEAQVTREFIFNGQRYRVGVPVNTTASLTTYRFGYEYDFVYTRRGYAGVQLDVKYTDVDVTLATPFLLEFTRQAAPIPTIGFVGRGYIVPNVSITGEFGFFKIPENLTQEFAGKYLDFDLYGTFNFAQNVAAQVGWRSIDVEYQAELDRGNLNFKGWYFGGVLRF